MVEKQRTIATDRVRDRTALVKGRGKGESENQQVCEELKTRKKEQLPPRKRGTGKKWRRTSKKQSKKERKKKERVDGRNTL